MHQLIYGNEPYLLNQAISKEIRKLVGKPDSMNTVVYDGTDQDFSIYQVLEEASTITFFSNHKVILIKNAVFLTRRTQFNEHEFKALAEFLQEKSDACSIFFIHEDDNLDTSKKVTKLVLERVQVTYVKKMAADAFRTHMFQLFKSRQVHISSSAFDVFIQRVDNNLSVAYHELEKLVLYQDEIKLEDVEALVSRPLDSEAFHLVNALMHKNMKEALTIFYDMMLLNLDPLSFSGLIASQLRLLYQIACLEQVGMQHQQMINELSGTHKINAFRLKHHLLPLVRQTNPKRILSLLNHLAQYDQKSKIGRLDKRFGFELFILEACQ
jgi:DNA polymerase III subunit delta